MILERCGSCGKTVGVGEPHSHDDCLAYLTERWYPVSYLRAQLEQVTRERERLERENASLRERLTHSIVAEENEKLRKALERIAEAARPFLEAEWMVTCDWAPSAKREPLYNALDAALAALEGE
jgi:hypothetical protein